jgi:hypothetical protein
MKRNLSNTDISRLVRRILKEDDISTFDIESTVTDTGAFGEDEIPTECRNNPEMTPMDSIKACQALVTQQSEKLKKTIEALNQLFSSAESKSNSIQIESRRRLR